MNKRWYNKYTSFKEENFRVNKYYPLSKVCPIFGININIYYCWHDQKLIYSQIFIFHINSFSKVWSPLLDWMYILSSIISMILRWQLQTEDFCNVFNDTYLLLLEEKYLKLVEYIHFFTKPFWKCWIRISFLFHREWPQLILHFPNHRS